MSLQQELPVHPAVIESYIPSTTSSTTFLYEPKHFFVQPAFIPPTYPFRLGHRYSTGYKINYFEFRGDGQPPHDIGVSGDLWIDRTPPNYALYSRAESGWLHWPALNFVQKVLITHPWITTRVLWCATHSVIWCTRETVVRNLGKMKKNGDQLVITTLSQRLLGILAKPKFGSKGSASTRRVTGTEGARAVTRMGNPDPPPKEMLKIEDLDSTSLVRPTDNVPTAQSQSSSRVHIDYPPVPADAQRQIAHNPEQSGLITTNPSLGSASVMLQDVANTAGVGACVDSDSARSVHHTSLEDAVLKLQKEVAEIRELCDRHEGDIRQLRDENLRCKAEIQILGDENRWASRTSSSATASGVPTVASSVRPLERVGVDEASEMLGVTEIASNLAGPVSLDNGNDTVISNMTVLPVMHALHSPILTSPIDNPAPLAPSPHPLPYVTTTLITSFPRNASSAEWGRRRSDDGDGYGDGLRKKRRVECGVVPMYEDQVCPLPEAWHGDVSGIQESLLPRCAHTRESDTEVVIHASDKGNEGGISLVYPNKPRRIHTRHLDVLYILYRNRRYCRSCLMRHSTNSTFVFFPADVPAETLAAHCEDEHPVACEKLWDKTNEELRDIREEVEETDWVLLKRSQEMQGGASPEEDDYDDDLYM